MSRKTSVVMIFSLPMKTLLKLILWQKREYLVHGSFQIQKRKKKNLRQSSDSKEDLKSLNKSLLLS